MACYVTYTGKEGPGDTIENKTFPTLWILHLNGQDQIKIKFKNKLENIKKD